jgi:hypothetical protein
VNDDEAEVKDAINDIDWVTRTASYFFGISTGDLEITSDKVMVSNYSKFCKTEEEAIKTVENYKTQEIDTFYEKQKDLYVIYRSDGKIMKNINYLPVSEL